MTISHGARAERRERLIEQARNGTSISELTAEFGLNRTYIRRILKDNGVAITTPNKTRRLQTVTCAVCGDSHSAESKYRLRAVCHKPDCRLQFDDNHRDVATHERNLAMLDLSVEGLTLQTIGDKYDISRERVRQIIVEYGGQPHSQKVKTSHCVACNIAMQYVGKAPDKYCSDKCRQDTRQAGWDRTAEIHKSRALARDAKWSRFIFKTYNCDGCGASFKRSNYIHSITRDAYSPEKLASKRTFCSRDCYLEKRWPDFAGNPNKELKENQDMMTDMTKTERDQLGEKLHEAINIALIGLGVNFNPRANDLGDEIDDLVEQVLDFSAKHNSSHSERCGEENTEEISNG